MTRPAAQHGVATTHVQAMVLSQTVLTDHTQWNWRSMLTEPQFSGPPGATTMLGCIPCVHVRDVDHGRTAQAGSSAAGVSDMRGEQCTKNAMCLQ